MLEIVLSKPAAKQLGKVPSYIATKFEYWCDLIKSIGLNEARKYKGFHDEPLQGQRFGQRSVRLSRSYRVIYKSHHTKQIEIVQVLEVNKHEY